MEAAYLEQPKEEEAATLLSIVIPARNEGGYLPRTVEQMLATIPLAGEVIVINNGARDHHALQLYSSRHENLRLVHRPPLGVAGARNVGARLSRGEIVVFADAHVEVGPGWWEPLVEALEDDHVGAVAPVISVMGQPEKKGYGLRFSNAALDCAWLGQQGDSPYPVPLLGGAFIAMRRKTLLATGGFDDRMTVYGSEDLEYSLRLWLLGYRQLVIPTVDVAHLFRGRQPYQVDWDSVLYNKLRLAFAHLNLQRLEQVLEAVKANGVFGAALARLTDSDIWQRREQLIATRTYDDDWYFEQLGCDLTTG